MHTRILIKSTLLLCFTALLISIPATELSAQTEQDLVTPPPSSESRESSSEHPDTATTADTEEDVIYSVVVQEAVYPGGNKQLMQDISRNFNYPKKAREHGKQGRVIIRFVVEKDGSISDITSTRPQGYGLDEAAILAVSQLRNFTPAKQDGEPVRSYYSIPINCSLN